MKSTIRKKTYNLDHELIDKVRRALGAKTDTQAIHSALQQTLDNQEIERALEALIGQGRFRNVYR